MIKVSENILIKSLDDMNLLLLQSTGEYDYREEMTISNKGNLLFCIDTLKFMTIYQEGIVEIIQEPTWVVIKTSDGEYRLPILRERGILLSKPEVTLPEDEQIKDSWEYDFSGKSVDSKVNSNSISQAAMVVTLGNNLLARSVNNVMELYGDASTAKISIIPQEYSIISKLGKVKFTLYNNWSLKVEAEKVQVRIAKVHQNLDVYGVENSLIQQEVFSNIDFSQVKLKTVNKFSFDQVYVTLKPDKVVFTSDSVRKTFEISLPIENEFTLQVYLKDLKYFTGQISLFKKNNGSRPFYIIRSVEKEKTVYLMLMEYRGEIKW